MSNNKITVEKYVLKLFTMGIIITVGVFGVSLPIIVIFQNMFQDGITFTRLSDVLTVPLILPTLGIVLVISLSFARSLGTAIIFFRNEKSYSTASLAVFGLLVSLILYYF